MSSVQGQIHIVKRFGFLCVLYSVLGIVVKGTVEIFFFSFGDMKLKLNFSIVTCSVYP